MSLPQRFIFLSGSLAIDFTLTGGEGKRARWERWHAPSDLQDWAAASPDLGIRPTATATELAQARALREALWRISRSHIEHTSCAAEDLALIEAVAATPDLQPVWRGGRRAWMDGAAFSQVMSSVARDAMVLFGTALVERFRECANPHCQLMFVDHSRPGKRQWCSMSHCGNLSKVARHRAKAKGDNHVHDHVH